MRMSDGWSALDQPAPREQHQWIHVPAQRPLPVVVLSSTPTTYEGHWYDGMMVPCQPTGGCALCDRRVGRQLRIVLSVFDLRLRAGSLLELGLPAARAVRDLADRAGALRGLVLELSKDGQRDRGRVLVAIPDNTHPVVPDPLPPPADVKAALLATWAHSRARTLPGLGAKDTTP